MKAPHSVMAAVLAAAFVVAGLSACSQEPHADGPAASREASAAEEAPLSDAADAEPAEGITVAFTNGTNLSIEGVAFTMTGSTQAPADAVVSVQPWAPGVSANVFFEEADQDDAAQDQEEALAKASKGEGDLVLSDVFTLQFTAEDGSVFAVHQVSLSALAGMQDVTVCYDAASGAGYLTFLDEGVQVSTLEGEQQRADAAAAVAAAQS